MGKALRANSVANSPSAFGREVEYETFVSERKEENFNVSVVMPAGTAALFFGDLFDDGESLGLAMLADGGEYRMDQSDGSSIRRPVRIRFNARQKCFVADARERRKISIRDGDAMRAASPCMFRAFHGLAQSAAK